MLHNGEAMKPSEKEELLLHLVSDEAYNRLSEEERLSCVFDENTKDMSERIRMYENDTEYFSKQTFDKRTNGLGPTAAFRAYLRGYMKNGRRVKMPKRIRESPQQSAAERLYAMYEYSLFWKGAEQMRDLHHEQPPVLIFGKEALPKEAVSSRELARISRVLGRPIILA